MLDARKDGSTELLSKFHYLSKRTHLILYVKSINICLKRHRRIKVVGGRLCSCILQELAYGHECFK